MVRFAAVTRSTALVRWIAPIAWIAVAVAGGPALSGALDGRSAAVRTVAIVGAWTAWTVAAVASAIPSTPSLTVVRVIVPGALVVAAASATAGASAVSAVLLASAAALATALCGTAELGRTMVQASAYGDEVRLPLRPPVGFGLVALLAWIVWLGCLLAGPLLLAAGVLVAGIPLTLLAAFTTVVLPRRWHQLSRRWLVFVPAGVVVHDRLVLAETLMVRRDEVASLSLALAGTEAPDLTGPAAGHAVEVSTTVPVTALVAVPAPGDRRGEVSLTAFLVAPSRPGAALAEAERRRLPVGPA